MRWFFVGLLGVISCGKTDKDADLDLGRAGTEGAPASHGGSQNVAGSPPGGSTSAAGAGGSAGAMSAGGGESTTAGTSGATSGGAGGTSTDSDGGAESGGAGGEGGAIDLSDYSCESYPVGECLDGSTHESYACCPPESGAPCVTGLRKSTGEDFRCDKDSCQCAAEAFHMACYGNGSPCLQKPTCETIWQYEHIYQGEHPGAAFNLYDAQITLIAPGGCGSIGASLQNHRVGSSMVLPIPECWKPGITLTSQVLLGGESDILELRAQPKALPAFEQSGARLELDVYRVSWDEDSLMFNASWRAVACQ